MFQTPYVANSVVVVIVVPVVIVVGISYNYDNIYNWDNIEEGAFSFIIFCGINHIFINFASRKRTVQSIYTKQWHDNDKVGLPGRRD
jgi:hypothetical protein